MVGVLAAGAGVFAIAYALLAATGASLVLLAPEGLRGSAFGLLAALQSVGKLAAGAVAGALWTLVSPRAASSTPRCGWCWPLAVLTRTPSRGA